MLFFVSYLFPVLAVGPIFGVTGVFERVTQLNEEIFASRGHIN